MDKKEYLEIAKEYIENISNKIKDSKIDNINEGTLQKVVDKLREADLATKPNLKARKKDVTPQEFADEIFNQIMNYEHLYNEYLESGYKSVERGKSRYGYKNISERNEVLPGFLRDLIRDTAEGMEQEYGKIDSTTYQIVQKDLWITFKEDYEWYAKKKEGTDNKEVKSSKKVIIKKGRANGSINAGVKEDLIELGMKPEEFDTHESDLYVKKTPIADKYLETYKYKDSVTTFKNNKEPKGEIWYDFSFANDEFWDKKKVKSDMKDILKNTKDGDSLYDFMLEVTDWIEKHGDKKEYMDYFTRNADEWFKNGVTVQEAQDYIRENFNIKASENNGKYYILDNGGESLDRYTLIAKDGDMYGFNAAPYHPQGIGQFVGNIFDKSFGNEEGITVDKWVEGYMAENPNEKEITVEELPTEDAKKFVLERITDAEKGIESKKVNSNEETHVWGYEYKTVKIDSPEAKQLQNKGYKVVNTYPNNGTVQFEIPKKNVKANDEHKNIDKVYITFNNDVEGRHEYKVGGYFVYSWETITEMILSGDKSKVDLEIENQEEGDSRSTSFTFEIGKNLEGGPDGDDVVTAILEIDPREGVYAKKNKSESEIIEDNKEQVDEHIASLIFRGVKNGRADTDTNDGIIYVSWKLNVSGNKLDSLDFEHISEKVKEGYLEGELNNGGWWDINKEIWVGETDIESNIKELYNVMIEESKVKASEFKQSEKYKEFRTIVLSMLTKALTDKAIKCEQYDKIMNEYGIEASEEEIGKILAEDRTPKPTDTPPQGKKYVWDATNKDWILVDAV